MWWFMLMRVSVLKTVFTTIMFSFLRKAKIFLKIIFIKHHLGEWSRMLRNYFAAVTPKPWTGDAPFHSPIAPKINVVTRYPTEAVSIVNPFYVETETIGRNIAYSDLTVDLLTR